MKLDVKSKLVERLSPLLFEHGFVYNEDIPGKFINKESDNFFVKIFLGISQKISLQAVSSFEICFYDVEKKLMELDSVPGLNFREFKRKNLYHTTLRHQFPEELILLRHKVNDEGDLDTFLLNVETYINKYGLSYIQKYSSLNEVLRSMDELTLQGKLWNQIINGGPEFLFRGLIISSLCGDDRYESKLSMVEKIVVEELVDEEWIDAFHGIKNILNP